VTVHSRWAGAQTAELRATQTHGSLPPSACDAIQIFNTYSYSLIIITFIQMPKTKSHKQIIMDILKSSKTVVQKNAEHKKKINTVKIAPSKISII